MDFQLPEQYNNNNNARLVIAAAAAEREGKKMGGMSAEKSRNMYTNYKSLSENFIVKTVRQITMGSKLLDNKNITKNNKNPYIGGISCCMCNIRAKKRKFYNNRDSPS